MANNNFEINNEKIDEIINEVVSSNYYDKNKCIKQIQNKLKKYGVSENTIENKTRTTIEKKVLKKQFNYVLNVVRDELKKVGTDIKRNEDYDGLIVKELPDSDIIRSNKEKKDNKQTDIRLNIKQRLMFPYLEPLKEYMEDSASNNSLKNFYILKIPVCLNQSNLKYLKEKTTKHQENRLLKSYTTILKDNRDRIEMSSQYDFDGEYFKKLRELLYKNDYLIILKNKEKFNYEAYAIKSNDISSDTDLSELNGKFFHINTKTPVNAEYFEILEDIEKNRLCGGENVLIYGVPGSGKSWTIKNKYCNDESHMERVVFHPDYTYSDFIGQILPKVNNGQIKYEFTPGPFTRILKKAYENYKQQFYLVIEEINRGNAPAIFGDIFQLLDRKTEQNNNEYPIGTSEYEISNSDIAEAVYGNKEHKIRIPSNLTILATMNTSDQNVFTLDTAFQRRWNMKLINNSFDNVDEEFKNKKIVDTTVTWEKFCTEINNIILENNELNLSSEDKRMGVYFVQIKDLENSNKFSEKVLKYLWDDVFKFSRDDIFNTNQYSLETIINQFNLNIGNNRYFQRKHKKQNIK